MPPLPGPLPSPLPDTLLVPPFSLVLGCFAFMMGGRAARAPVGERSARGLNEGFFGHVGVK
jgi:hypothetical protein